MRAFFSGIIDYAGLFPPAAQDMSAAVREYAMHLDGPDRDLLGRFVVPVTRLDEFAAASQPFVNGNAEKWKVSAIATEHPQVTRDVINRFNSTHSAVQCDSVEMPVASYDDIMQAASAFGESIALFLEVSPLRPDFIAEGDRADQRLGEAPYRRCCRECNSVS